MSDQYILSLTLLALLGLFIWGKVRYDALAVGALFVLVVLEIIPANEAFLGFAHPAVMTVALVLIISQGLSNSGIAGLVGKLIGGREFTEMQFMISLLLIAAVLSSFINASKHCMCRLGTTCKVSSLPIPSNVNRSCGQSKCFR